MLHKLMELLVRKSKKFEKKKELSDAAAFSFTWKKI
jgi:hypothetical protein